MNFKLTACRWFEHLQLVIPPLAFGLPELTLTLIRHVITPAHGPRVILIVVSADLAAAALHTAAVLVSRAFGPVPAVQGGAFWNRDRQSVKVVV